MTARERIQKYLDYRGITGYRFEKEIGKSKGTWASCKNPTAEFLCKVVDIYTELSAEWLLRGEGEMIKSKSPEHNVYDINYGNRVTGNNNITGNTAPVHYNTETEEDTYNEVVALRNKTRELQKKLDEANDRNAALTDKLLKLI